MCEEATDESFIRAAREALNEMRISDALRLFDRAELAGDEPDICAAGRWTCYMLSGRFEKAWEESDAIEGRGNPDPHRFWDGTPFRGKHVMIRCLHGLGDTIQFVRFVPLIRNGAATVTVEAQPGLKTLLAQCGIADRVITWGEQEPPWNQQIEINELPKIFRVTEGTILGAPYLSVPKQQRPRLRTPSGTLKVGLVWSASVYNPLRSIRLDEMAPLFEATRAVVLQPPGRICLPGTSAVGGRYRKLERTCGRCAGDSTEHVGDGSCHHGRHHDRPSRRRARYIHLDLAPVCLRLALDEGQIGYAVVPQHAIIPTGQARRLGLSCRPAHPGIEGAP